MLKRIIIYISVFQVLIILSIGIFIINKRKQVLGSTINTIQYKSIEYSPTEKLKYFYEPKKNTLIKDKKKGQPYFGEYNINSDTFNSLRDYSFEKPQATQRIVVLGDSFTYGLYVNTADNWPSLLEEKLNSKKCKSNFEVINLGMEGYDSRYVIERFKKRGIKYNPDIVIWLHVDLLRVRDLLPPVMNKYLKEEGNNNTKTNINAWKKAMTELRSSYGDDGLLEYNIKAIESITEYYNGKLLMVPMSGMVVGHEREALRNLSIKNHWEYYANLVDIYDEGAYYENDLHPNYEGHKLIAEDIFNYLKNSNTIACR